MRRSSGRVGGRGTIGDLTLEYEDNSPITTNSAMKGDLNDAKPRWRPDASTSATLVGPARGWLRSRARCDHSRGTSVIMGDSAFDFGGRVAAYHHRRPYGQPGYAGKRGQTLSVDGDRSWPRRHRWTGQRR